MSSILSFVTLALYAAQASAAIGPVTDLLIANGVVAPDGFSRKFVIVYESIRLHPEDYFLVPFLLVVNILAP
jgi:hypothetical protein